MRKQRPKLVKQPGRATELLNKAAVGILQEADSRSSLITG